MSASSRLGQCGTHALPAPLSHGHILLSHTDIGQSPAAPLDQTLGQLPGGVKVIVVNAGHAFALLPRNDQRDRTGPDSVFVPRSEHRGHEDDARYGTALKQA